MSGHETRMPLADLIGAPPHRTPPAQVTLARARASTAAFQAEQQEQARRLEAAMERLEKARQDWRSWLEECSRETAQIRAENERMKADLESQAPQGN